MRPACALLAAACLVGGCAAQGDFPSLARRPAENDLSIEEPVRPAVEVATDAALSSRVAELRAEAAAGDRAFESALTPATLAVARAGGRETESWTAAQQALSRLEAAREATMRALGDLDALALSRAGMPTNSGDFAGLNASLSAVQAMAAGQQERLDGLRARLSGR
jgi:hypothetical protein